MTTADSWRIICIANSVMLKRIWLAAIASLVAVDQWIQTKFEGHYRMLLRQKGMRLQNWWIVDRLGWRGRFAFPICMLGLLGGYGGAQVHWQLHGTQEFAFSWTRVMQPCCVRSWHQFGAVSALAILHGIALVFLVNYSCLGPGWSGVGLLVGGHSGIRRRAFGLGDSREVHLR